MGRGGKQASPKKVCYRPFPGSLSHVPRERLRHGFESREQSIDDSVLRSQNPKFRRFMMFQTYKDLRPPGDTQVIGPTHKENHRVSDRQRPTSPVSDCIISVVPVQLPDETNVSALSTYSPHPEFFKSPDNGGHTNVSAHVHYPLALIPDPWYGSDTSYSSSISASLPRDTCHPSSPRSVVPFNTNGMPFHSGTQSRGTSGRPPNSVNFAVPESSAYFCPPHPTFTHDAEFQGIDMSVHNGVQPLPSPIMQTSWSDMDRTTLQFTEQLSFLGSDATQNSINYHQATSRDGSSMLMHDAYFIPHWQ